MGFLLHHILVIVTIITSAAMSSRERGQSGGQTGPAIDRRSMKSSRGYRDF
jgi:hypothetical protein